VIARTIEGIAQTDVRVIPATRSIEFSPRALRARVGDTLRVTVLARDAARRVVAHFPPEAHVGGTNRSGSLVDWDKGGRVVIVAEAPGIIILASRLGARTDTLRVVVRR
jgi:hypothetical protein